MTFTSFRHWCGVVGIGGIFLTILLANVAGLGPALVCLAVSLPLGAFGLYDFGEPGKSSFQIQRELDAKRNPPLR